MAEDRDDPLADYRGRPSQDEYSRSMDELAAFRALADGDDINLPLLRSILKADQLVEALNEESSSLQRLVTHATIQLDEACIAWFSSNDPTSDEAVVAHHNARAARILIDWVGDILKVARQAEDIMNSEEEHDGQTEELPGG